MGQQDLDYKWYKDNIASLYSKYAGKFLVIAEKQVVSTAATYDAALEEGLKTMKAGDFIVQQCTETLTLNYCYNPMVKFA